MSDGQVNDAPGSIGIGVLGGASFVATQAVLPGIDAAADAHLAAIASRSGGIDHRWIDQQVDDYIDVLTHPDVDAVYLPLPNGLHEEWAIMAAHAGKHVLCEKPLAPTAAAARRMADACRDGGVLLAEAWMTPFDLRWQRVLDDIGSGTIGEIDRIDARFTFTIDADADRNYRWDPAQGGGALLDVGIYTLGAAITLWGTDVARITVGDRVLDDRFTPGESVDARTDATLTWPDGQRAHIVCSFVDDEQQRLSIAGSSGTITVTDDAFTGGAAATDHFVEGGAAAADHRGENGGHRTMSGPASSPYQVMIEAFAAAIQGTRPWPRPPHEATALIELLERIATEPVTP